MEQTEKVHQILCTKTFFNTTKSYFVSLKLTLYSSKTFTHILLKQTKKIIIRIILTKKYFTLRAFHILCQPPRGGGQCEANIKKMDMNKY